MRLIGLHKNVCLERQQNITNLDLKTALSEFALLEVARTKTIFFFVFPKAAKR